MQLILTIENGPQPEMSGKVWRCGTEGGSLGRNPDCDLVLPDSKRYTSSVHAQIAFDNDGFTLTDRSTNGTYHNSPKTLIGKNRSVSLDRGDKLYIGDFVLRVDVEDSDAGSDRPASAGTSQFDGGDDRGDDRHDNHHDNRHDNRHDNSHDNRDDDRDDDSCDNWPETGSGSESDDGFGFDDDDVEPADSGAGGGDSQPWDNSEFSVPWDGQGTEPDADDDAGFDSDDRSFSQSPEREYFAAPSTSAGGGDAIPDDWDDFLTGFHDPAGMGRPDDASARTDESTPRSDRDGDSSTAPGSDSGPGGREPDDRGDKPFADAEPGEDERFEPPPAPTPRPARNDKTPPAGPAPTSRPAENADASPDARQAPAPEPARESTPERPSTESARSTPAPAPARSVDAGASDDQIREILQVVTEGLMGLLHGRAEIKNEFRIAQTRFVQTENNPLKFSPDADEALKRILAEEDSPGFLTGKRAFEDAFDDIQAHQLAILSAVQRAIESAVAQFDPAQIEKKLERISPMSARMPGLKAAKCWNLFSLHYEEMAEKMRDDARQLFLNEFAEAYEEACRAVARGRRDNES